MSSPLLSSCFLLRSGAHRALHSFPTRRSSDLRDGSARARQARPHSYAGRRRAVVTIDEIRAFAITLPRSTEALISSIVTTDRKSTRLNSSHVRISYAVFCLKKKKRLSSKFVVL